MTPHLIHIGYAKAGSTILQRWFEAHSQIAFAAGRVLGIRSVYDISRGERPIRGTTRLRVTSDESLATPHPAAGGKLVPRPEAWGLKPHSGADRVCEDLADLFPHAHILIVTRGFRHMMLSGYSQFVRSGGTATFAEMQESFNEDYDTFNVFDYSATIRHYECLFPGRVIFLPFELLRHDSRKFLSVVEEKFGLDHEPLPEMVVNPSLSAVELAWYPRFTSLAERLPLPGRIKNAVLRAHLRTISAGRLRKLAAACQKVRPLTPVTANMVSDAALQEYRCKTSRLRDNPLYRPYASDYLLEFD
ncbi:sulfotransferase [Allosphingosinicella deserti]|uniref:Sulfotransferase domain-containing protein n=1 Tax=Allosphingosinicella deserti TaxID=2116704 RepID=A0A2P7QEA3_9SPHN|nr:sulfotransferase [Sphingomonas deserti]PSJ36265.1 hypothetical protein C7I55_27150 [Sphingomonas deserti]